MLFNEGRTARIKIRVRRRAIKNSFANWTAITDRTIAGESVLLKRMLLNFSVYTVRIRLCDLHSENDMSDRPRNVFRTCVSPRWF